ncbi:MAG: hypothetical protein ACJAZ2_000334, partial [Glaciecola sp.]
MKKITFILIILAFTGKCLQAQSQFAEYKSYDFFINNTLLDNKQYGPVTAPSRLHIGAGVGMGLSVNDNFNLLLGLNFLQVKPNNTRSDYTFCTSASCVPISVSNQLFLPIGAEYYTNTNQSPFQLFYALRLIPAFSVTEVTEMIPFDNY